MRGSSEALRRKKLHEQHLAQQKQQRGKTSSSGNGAGRPQRPHSWATPRSGIVASKPKRSGDIIAQYDEMQHARNTIARKGGLSVDQYRKLLLGNKHNSSSSSSSSNNNNTQAPLAGGGAGRNQLLRSSSTDSGRVVGAGAGGAGVNVAVGAGVGLSEGGGGGGGGGSGGAVVAMSRRLQALEAAHADAVTKLQEARTKNELLRQTVTDLKGVIASREQNSPAAAGGGGGESTVVISLRQENVRLKKKVSEMEAFLKGSGLKWTGYKDRSVDVFSGAGKSLRGHAGFDVDELLRQIKQLNIAAQRKAAESATSSFSSSSSSVGALRSGYERRGDGSYRLRQATKPLPLTIYKDGIFLMRGPLRPYTHPSTVAFLTDIANGHFPYEFKQRYPNGVEFDVTDKRHVNSADDKSASSSSSSSSSAAAPMSTSQFLSNVPERKIMSGEMVNLRQDMRGVVLGGVETSSVKKYSAATASTTVLRGSPKRSLQSPKPPEDRQLGLLSKSKSSTSRSTTPNRLSTNKDTSDGGDSLASGGAKPAGKRCKLLVTFPGGVETLRLSMSESDTIADLRAKVRVEGHLTYKFEIRTAFPSRAYTDLERTLAEEKLVPSAKVLVVQVN